MARITVEDCLKKIPNRFQMVLVAAYRARQISQGYAPKIDAKDKPAVIALREVADGLVGTDMLKHVHAVIQGPERTPDRDGRTAILLYRIGSEGAGRSCFQFRPTHQSPPGKPPAA